MFTQGRITFIIIFFSIFIFYLIWAYRKDIAKSPWYFKGSLKIVIALISIYAAYFILTRWVI